MSSVDIILLGMLIEDPMSAYEMNKIIEKRHIRDWLKISEAAVYRNLRLLRDSGCTDSRTEKQGLMPSKIIYTITPKGREYFVELMEKASMEPVRLHFDFDTLVAHFHHLSPEKSMSLLKNLENNLLALNEELGTAVTALAPLMPVSAHSLIKLRLSCLGECLTWINDFSKVIEKQAKEK